MADRSRHFDDAGKTREPTGNREGKQHQTVGVEPGKSRRPRRSADQPYLKSHDHAPEQHRRQHHHDQRDDRAGMHTAGPLEQRADARRRIEGRRGGKVHSLRIAPRTAHHVVEAEIGDIDQHQAGEDFAGAEIHAADRRDKTVERAAERAEHEHGRQHPMADIGAVGAHGKPTSAHCAGDELAFGADVPDVGDVAEREPNRDHHKRRRLDGDLLEGERVGQRLDEIDPDRVHRVLAHDREQDREGDDRQHHGDQGRCDRDHRRPFGPAFKHQLHTWPLVRRCARRDRRRPSAIRAVRAWLARLQAAPTACHETSPRCGRRFPPARRDPD